MTKKEDAYERLDELYDDIKQVNYLMTLHYDYEELIALQKLLKLLKQERMIIRKKYY